jgi:antitoxin component YwqK of YwqJK toxin-antitoxin module
MRKINFILIIFLLKSSILLSQNKILFNGEYFKLYSEKIEEPSIISPNEKIFRNSLENGKWIAYSIYENDYCIFEVENNNINGKYYYSNGKVKWSFEYIENLKAGSWKRFSENNILIEEIPYENDLAHGQIKKYSNGNFVAYMDYVKGKKQGKFVAYYENGFLKYDGTHINDKLEGPFFNYDNKGNIDYIEIYEDGELKILKTYKNGKLTKTKKIKSKT